LIASPTLESAGRHLSHGFVGWDSDFVSESAAHAPHLAHSREGLDFADFVVLSIETSLPLANATSGAGHPAVVFPLALDNPLPDRQACLLAAAQAAASWARDRRGAWDELAPEPTRAPEVGPTVPAPLGHAIAEALRSAMSLDNDGDLAPRHQIPAAVPEADKSAVVDRVALNTPPAATPLFAVHHAPLPAAAAPAAAAPGGTQSTEHAWALPVVAPASTVHAGEDAVPSRADAHVHFDVAATDVISDAALADVFAPLLARDSAPPVDAPPVALEHDDVAVRETSDAPVTLVEADRPASPAFEFEHVPAGPSLAARMWSSIGGALGRVAAWWPQLAVVTVLLVIGVAGRMYWPKLMAAKPGVAVLESVPDGSQIAIDGKTIGTTPVTATLAAGEHSVEFRFRKAVRTVRVSVTAGGRTVERIDWTKKANGRLQVHSDPPGAKVSVDGVARGVTPLTLDDLPVGPHAVVLERANGSIERTVTVDATEIARVNEMIFPGWVTVFSPFTLNITEGARPIRLDDRNQVMLPSGTHDLRFENRALGYEETRRVDIKSGAVTTLSIVPPHSTLTVSATQPSEVFLDGVSVGQTPLNGVPVELGTREVVVRNAEGDVRRFTETVTTKPLTVDANFSRPAE
jgi:hypothetical protein